MNSITTWNHTLFPSMFDDTSNVGWSSV